MGSVQHPNVPSSTAYGEGRNFTPYSSRIDKVINCKMVIKFPSMCDLFEEPFFPVRVEIYRLL
jgi:hypothetical protein